MIDLPANVSFPAITGWRLDQQDDVILTVQAFLGDATLKVEIWGTTTLINAEGERHTDRRFVQIATINLDRSTVVDWSVERTVYQRTLRQTVLVPEPITSIEDLDKVVSPGSAVNGYNSFVLNSDRQVLSNNTTQERLEVRFAVSSMDGDMFRFLRP